MALVICLAATAVVWIQAQRLRQGAPPTVAPMVEATAFETPESRPSAPSEQTRELARLRNEVVQLRAEKKQLESARRENAELNLNAKTAAPAPRREPPPGFIGKEKLTNAGYATPADAVQTFFWAMRDADFNALVASFAPGSKERQRYEQMSAEQREKLRLKLMDQGRPNVLDQLTDLGVRGQEILSEDSVAVHVGSSLATNTVRMRLDRTPDGWKLHDPGF
jgi:hypothetical protein